MGGAPPRGAVARRLIAATAVLAAARPAGALDNGLGCLPPMGRSAWVN